MAASDKPRVNTYVGLGLGLVKSIVEMHGGTVQARSEGLNQGTEISIRLPLRPAAALRQAGLSFQIQAISGTPANTTRTDSGRPNFQ